MQDGHEYCEPGKPMCNRCKAEAFDARPCAEGCSHPEHKNEITEADVLQMREKMIAGEAEKITAALSLSDKRLAFVGGLYAKAEVSHLKRIEALVILQATLAEMLHEMIPGLKAEAEKIEPGSISRANALLMVEIAEELHREAVLSVDHAMKNSRLIVVPR
jgi:hypothetical protein